MKKLTSLLLAGLLATAKLAVAEEVDQDIDFQEASVVCVGEDTSYHLVDNLLATLHDYAAVASGLDQTLSDSLYSATIPGGRGPILVEGQRRLEAGEWYSSLSATDPLSGRTFTFGQSPSGTDFYTDGVTGGPSCADLERQGKELLEDAVAGMALYASR